MKFCYVIRLSDWSRVGFRAQERKAGFGDGSRVRVPTHGLKSPCVPKVGTRGFCVCIFFISLLRCETEGMRGLEAVGCRMPKNGVRLLHALSKFFSYFSKWLPLYLIPTYTELMSYLSFIYVFSWVFNVFIYLQSVHHKLAIKVGTGYSAKLPWYDLS